MFRTSFNSRISQPNSVLFSCKKNLLLSFFLWILWVAAPSTSRQADLALLGKIILAEIIVARYIPGNQMIFPNASGDIWRNKSLSSCWVDRERTNHQDSSGQGHYDRWRDLIGWSLGFWGGAAGIWNKVSLLVFSNICHYI